MHRVNIFAHLWLHEGSGIQIRTMVNFLGLRFFWDTLSDTIQGE